MTTFIDNFNNKKRIVDAVKKLTDENLLDANYSNVYEYVVGDKELKDLSIEDITYLYDVLVYHERKLNKLTLSTVMFINPRLKFKDEGSLKYDGTKFIIDDSYVDDLKYISGVFTEDKKQYFAKPSTAYVLAKYAADKNITLDTSFKTQLLTLIEVFEKSLSLDSDYEIKSNIKRNLFDFQRVAVDYVLNSKRTFICDQMGCGKTTEAIVSIIEADVFPCLVIVPSVVKYNWEKEWNDVTDEKTVVVLEDMDEFVEADVYITNYDNLHKYTNYSLKKKKQKKDKTREKKELRELELLYDEVGGENVKRKLREKKSEMKKKTFNVDYKPIHGVDIKDVVKSVIIDESHYVKSGDAIRTKLCKHYTNGKEWIILLSGTPIVNHSQEIVSQLQVLNRLEDYGEFPKFAQKYCNFGDHYKRTNQGRNKKIRGYKLPSTPKEREEYNYNLRELNHRLRSLSLIRRQKKDVLSQLPEKVRKIVPIIMDNSEEYIHASTDIESYLLTLDDYDEDRVNKVKEYMDLIKVGKLKKLAGEGKKDSVYKYTKDLINSGQKVVIFAHHRDLVSYLIDKFDDPLYVIGEQNDEDKQRAVDEFQNNKDRKVIICSITAASVGITLTASSDVVFAELPWTPAEIEQAEDRCHRIGQKYEVNIHYMVGKPDPKISKELGIEDRILKVIDKKREVGEHLTQTVEDIKMEIAKTYK